MRYQMRPSKLSYTPAALNATGFKENATGASTTLTATTPDDGLAHLVTLYSGSNIATIVFTLTGTDADGAAQTETMTGVNNSTVTSTKYFKTLSSVAFSATIGAAELDIGWDQVAIGQTYPIDYRSTSACNIFVDISGTINYSIQQSFANVHEDSSYLTAFSAITALAAKTADTAGQANEGATAIRLLVNTVTAGATVAIYTSQP